MANEQKTDRRQQILEALVLMLEQDPGARITTAKLAKAVGVSEAALYRHFPSKARMYEGIIDFIEQSIFGQFNQIRSKNDRALDRVSRMMLFLLAFAERNPGICRLLTGDVLSGEVPRLHERIEKLFDRVQLHFKQVLQEAMMQDETRQLAPLPAANLLLAIVEGRISQFVRSHFNPAYKPTKLWPEQWTSLSHMLFK